MIFQKLNVASCCGKDSIIYILSSPITKELMNGLLQFNYKEVVNFTKLGVLYVDGKSSFITGTFGSNRLQFKCKLKDCPEINQIEDFLSRL